MPILQYMVAPARDGAEGHTYVPLPADFTPRFVATAKRNGSFKLERDPDYPDIIHMTGKDKKGRSVVGSWSTSNALGGSYCIMFHDEADRLPGEVTP